jgi:transcriptional regulator with XRE-family HTH domain
MVTRNSVRQERLLKEFGANIRRWRKVNGMSAAALAERAFVTRETLRNIEEGTGSPRMDSLFAVLSVIGIAETVVGSADPFSSAVARPRIDAILKAGGVL